MASVEQWSSFLQEQWYILILVFVLLVVVVSIIKTVLKWVVIVAIILGTFYYVSEYEIADDLVKAASSVMDNVQQEAVELLKGELAEAQFTAQPDGSFEIESSQIKLEGALESEDLTVHFQGQSFTIKKPEWVKDFVQEQLANQI
ncbi:hypothetical protein [Longirhabdus pacifica]|uniref:hypothetical protein n=1 Tax=Longirhabdus pacifica TaxID=2305227 RepID=UPI0010090DC0|nr:hypothetical protein [Longirhabdus pacifica]